MTNQINITALVQTVERLIREVKGTKKTIGAICAEWNRVCHENGIGNCKLTTPRKRATLVHELFDVINVLNLIDPRCDEEGNDPREWCGNDIEAAHAEALEDDKRFNWLHNRWCLFHSSSRQQQEEIIGVAWEQARMKEFVLFLSAVTELFRYRWKV